jgi:hypothetical protein
MLFRLTGKETIMAEVQDKATEMLVGSGTPEDDWLEDTRGYRVRLRTLSCWDWLCCRQKIPSKPAAVPAPTVLCWQTGK